MKKAINLFIIHVLILISTGCAHAQNDVTDKQAIQMLKEFYTAYNTAWSTDVSTGILINKLDSLQKKYCSVKLRIILEKEFKKNGLDHDLLLNDQGTDIEHLKTLTVTKDPVKPNAFIVSYIAHTISAANKPIDVKVVIHVTVVNEGGDWKIASTDMSPTGRSL